MPRGVAKSDLPVRSCAHCARPFTWRARWARTWETVRYCSERCRGEARRARAQARRADSDDAAPPG